MVTRAVLGLVVGFALLLSTAAITAQQVPEARTERVQFARGTTSAEIKGQIKGSQDVDYQVGALAGQTLTIKLDATNGSMYFNVNPPDSDVSMFVGSTSGNSFTGLLPADGDYTIRVYLMRSAARRNESGGYTLTVGATGKGLAPLPASKDALVAGTSFHASATVTCVPPFDQKTQQCQAFVIRRGFDGTGTVEVRGPNGLKRRILFVKGKPAASDSPDALTVSRKGDLTIVNLGTDERYEIPDAFVVGG